MPEWFTISELRAASVPSFNERFFKMLVNAYPRFTSRQARVRKDADVFHALEFNIVLFTRAERDALARACGATPLMRRVLKLGIHRSVTVP